MTAYVAPKPVYIVHRINGTFTDLQITHTMCADTITDAGY